MRSGFNRMKRYCSAQAWRIKLVLSVVMIIFARSKAGGISSEDISEISDVTGHQKQQTGEARQASQARHRLRMLFPLLLRISSRLAQIVPMALAAMTATFVMAVLAKKAFLISLAAFGLMLYDTFRKKHRIVHYNMVPSHENNLISSYYVTAEPQKYVSHSDKSHSSQWKNYYNGHNLYGAGSNNIVQNISEVVAKRYQKATSHT